MAFHTRSHFAAYVQNDLLNWWFGPFLCSVWFSLSELSPQMRKCILHLFTSVLKHLKKARYHFYSQSNSCERRTWYNAHWPTLISRHSLLVDWELHFWRQTTSKANPTFPQEASFPCICPSEGVLNEQGPPWKDQLTTTAKPACHPTHPHREFRLSLFFMLTWSKGSQGEREGWMIRNKGDREGEEKKRFLASVYLQT